MHTFSLFIDLDWNENWQSVYFLHESPAHTLLHSLFLSFKEFLVFRATLCVIEAKNTLSLHFHLYCFIFPLSVSTHFFFFVSDKANIDNDWINWLQHIDFPSLHHELFSTAAWKGRIIIRYMCEERCFVIFYHFLLYVVIIYLFIFLLHFGFALIAVKLNSCSS